MKLSHFFTAAFLGLFLAAPGLAISFESEVQQGFLKKNAILTENFRFEFSDLIEDQADSNGDGISDTIEIIAEAAEHAFDVLVAEMGYPEPNSDVDRRIMVILDDRNSYLASGSLGSTSVLSNGDPYVAIDPFLSEELLKVTMAHEFYHVIQFDMGVEFAYTDQGVNLAESTATWSEEETYDSIDDYINYLQDFFDYPDYSILASYVPTGTLYEYALSIWPIFLSEEYGSDIIKWIWMDYQSKVQDYYDPLELHTLLSDLLDEEGSSLNEAYADFALWNLDLDFYSEGENYPDVFLLDASADGQLNLIGEAYAPALYGSNYLYFENIDNEEDFYFQIVKPDGIAYSITLVPVKDADYLGDMSQRIYLDAYESMDGAMLFDTSDYDSIVAIVSALDADFDSVSSPDAIFDEGFLYYYAASYGEDLQVFMDEVNIDVSDEKEGEEASGEDVKNIESLLLDLNEYDEDSVVLSWNRPDANIMAYDIFYWEEGSEEDIQIKSLDKGYITTAALTDLEEGINYSFQLYAYDENEAQIGDESNVISVTTKEWLFTDLSYLDKYYDAISSLVEMGIFQGYPDGSFQASGVINRAELLKILIEARGIEIDTNLYKNCFPDVREDWYAPYVCYAKYSDWVEGYPDGYFRPGDTVNKVEALKILFNVYEADLQSGDVEMVYPDLNGLEWYAPYVKEASSLGILEEGAGEDFNPTEGRTRGAMAEILYRYLTQFTSDISI